MTVLVVCSMLPLLVLGCQSVVTCNYPVDKLHLHSHFPFSLSFFPVAPACMLVALTTRVQFSMEFDLLWDCLYDRSCQHFKRKHSHLDVDYVFNSLRFKANHDC
jgi:hypothetical protein